MLISVLARNFLKSRKGMSILIFDLYRAMGSKFNCNLDITSFLHPMTNHLFVYKGNHLDRGWKVGLHLKVEKLLFGRGGGGGGGVSSFGEILVFPPPPLCIKHWLIVCTDPEAGLMLY